jgi:hypothetical protein
MLLNIVELRHPDTPVFLDVSSVISSCELASQVNLASNFFPNASADNNGSFTSADKRRGRQHRIA